MTNNTHEMNMNGETLLRDFLEKRIQGYVIPLDQLPEDSQSKFNYDYIDLRQYLQNLYLKGDEFEVEELDEGYDADIVLILATRTEAVGMTNQERLDVSFKKVLIPLKNNIKKDLDRGNTTLIIDREFTTGKFYNYGTKQAVRAIKKHPVGHIWDAFKIKVSVRFLDNCLKKINYHG